MKRSWIRSISAFVLASAYAASNAGAWECATFPSRRVEHFEKLARNEIARCLKRTDDCPDARLQARLDAYAGRVVRTIARRCPDSAAIAEVDAVRTRLLCTELGACSARTITVRVGNGGLGSGVAARAAVGAEDGRRLRADAGFSGLAHDLAILEGASYTAELSACDGADTLCDLHGATAGTAFGAPSPLSAGGVAICVTVDFTSDLVGTYDLATGDLSEEARVAIGVYLGEDADRPCPACVTVDGDPGLGEAGTCVGGANAGASCSVQGLGDPALGALRGTSDDCGPGTAPVALFESRATATTGAFDLAPLADGPSCTRLDFIGQKCPCSTCNDAAATACRSHADCPMSGGASGICGGRRCVNGSNAGAPCTSGSVCPGGVCLTPGEPTAKNLCLDAVCTPTGDEGGECLAGPIDTHCAVARHRGCASDDDCPAGDACVSENRKCHPDPIALAGTPDTPSAGRAHPTLVGGFCMAPAATAAVNNAAGFPGPVSYVWPTEVVFGQ